MPKAAHGIFDQLNWKMELSGKDFSLADAEWGDLPDGHVVGKPVPLFRGLRRVEAFAAANALQVTFRSSSSRIAEMRHYFRIRLGDVEMAVICSIAGLFEASSASTP